MKRELSLYLLLMLMITTLSYQQFVSRNQHSTHTLSINLKNDQILEIDIQAKVFITEGEGQSVVVEGPEKLLAFIKITESKDKLSINYSGAHYLKRMGFQGNQDKVQLYINLRDIDMLSFKTKTEIISSDYAPNLQEAPENLAQKDNTTWFQSASNTIFFDLNQIASKMADKAVCRIMKWLLPLQLNSHHHPNKNSACCNWV